MSPTTDDAGALAVSTPSDTEIVLTRTFAAPRRLVFDALTTPDLLVRWHGAQGWHLVECDVDLRVGGAWRFVSRGPGGAEMTMAGVYREVEPPARLVHTEALGAGDAGEALVTMDLDERDGRTTLTTTLRYPSRELRDAVAATRMAGGVGEAYDRLAEVLAATEAADRYRRVADAFGERVRAVPAGAWDDPSPCEAWAARDVVRHLVEWLPAFFFGTWGLDRPAIPPVDDDPAAAWRALDGALRAALADPAVATSSRDTPMGPATFAGMVDTICTNDVLVHTWDLARATGQDETLDPGEVRRMLDGIEEHDEAMRGSGHYGQRVPVPDDADDQTRLLAFLGRRP
ncbi:MAG TPA: TIGR03086 family metal-binding protein [Acidimicrobiales bacterium]